MNICMVLTCILVNFGSIPIPAAPDENGVLVQTEPERSVDEIEKVFTQMTPVNYTPPTDRWQYLPRTAAILGKGEEELRIEMLGDSIVNDTSRSRWEYLLQRQYPQCKITKITCVRGSTGCWWYKEPDRIKRYILDIHPNLLIIGGISTHDDTDSILELIQATRKQLNCDFLLMTPAFGPMDPKDDKPWAFGIDLNGKDFRTRLKRLAIEQKTGFIDMTAWWGKYIRESGKELTWFKRDPIHANERGEQILGRILAAHFNPPVK